MAIFNMCFLVSIINLGGDEIKYHLNYIKCSYHLYGIGIC